MPAAVGAAWDPLPHRLRCCRAFHEMAVARWLCRGKSRLPAGEEPGLLALRGFRAGILAGEMRALAVLGVHGVRLSVTRLRRCWYLPGAAWKVFLGAFQLAVARALQWGEGRSERAPTVSLQPGAGLALSGLWGVFRSAGGVPGEGGCPCRGIFGG